MYFATLHNHREISRHGYGGQQINPSWRNQYVITNVRLANCFLHDFSAGWSAPLLVVAKGTVSPRGLALRDPVAFYSSSRRRTMAKTPKDHHFVRYHRRHPYAVNVALSS